VIQGIGELKMSSLKLKVKKKLSIKKCFFNNIPFSIYIHPCTICLYLIHMFTISMSKSLHGCIYIAKKTFFYSNEVGGA
jgi:hypothetical protein